MTTFARLERCLLPPPETIRWNEGNLTRETYTTLQKVTYCAKNFFVFTALLLASPFTLTYDYLSSKQVTPVSQRTPDIAPLPPAWPPAQRGFATSLFQTAGLGTEWSAVPGLRGRCDWNEWMKNPEHFYPLLEKGIDPKVFFTDILSDPAATDCYIQMLKAHNVTAHRLSLEWSVIEPEPGKIDEYALALYNNLFERLLAEKITPSLTLSHFVVPEWFFEAGNFQNEQNIQHYVNFALMAMDRFPKIKDWWSFNELGVKAFQQSREVYPTDLPEGSPLHKTVYAAGIATRNMLIAHCKLHVEAEKRHPDKTVGVTHQWMKFDTATGNWLESLIAYFFTKFGFTPVYSFFKDGHYSFEFPFMANIQFEIPKEEFESHGHFLKRLGVQAYPKAYVKMGLNHGQTYPGFPGKIHNHFLCSFGASCEPGGTVMRFGPRWKAEEIDEILDDAFALTNEVYVTEYGSDAHVFTFGDAESRFDDAAQANYLRQLTERIRDYSARTFRTIKGIFCWSDLRRQMEWENHLDCRLGIVETKVDENRRMTDWEQTPASQYLAEAYRSPGAITAIDLPA